MEIITYQIFDRIFKKILTLSAGAVIRLINGLFDTTYPVDSAITYNWTEFHDDSLRRTLADTILTINGTDSYHMEAQMSADRDIVFRVFEYGYGHANRERFTRNGVSCLKFPEPRIIYLYYETDVPDRYTLHLEFGDQGAFDYTVPTLKFLETSAEELDRKHMIILIPFYLLKLRRSIENARTPENLDALKKLILNDIIGSINKNLQAGNLTPDDARKLKRLTRSLYDYLYSYYDELEELNNMTDESLMLDIDIIEKEHEEKLAEQERKFAERERELYAVIEEQNRRLEKLEGSGNVTDESLMPDIDRIEKEHEEKLAEQERKFAERERELYAVIGELKGQLAALRERA